MTRLGAGKVAFAAVVAAAFFGCTETRQASVNAVWSATVPAMDSVSSRTVNVFPFYSKNVTTFADRTEETGNILFIFSWSKVTALPPAQPATAQESGAKAATPEAAGSSESKL